MAKKKKIKEEKPESYPEYLRRVASDYRESAQMGSQGHETSSPTADDYDESAALIEDLAAELKLVRIVDLDPNNPASHFNRIKYLLKQVTR